MTELVSFEAIRAAAQRLAGIVHETPLETTRAVSERVGATTLLKYEHLQRTGSFKLRGAYNRMCQLDEQVRSRGVACASAGNHAQGVALSAKLLDIPAKVFMPSGTPLPKLAATRSYGADVELVGETFDEAYAASEAWAEANGATYVHPFDHPDVIAGQGTIGLEILDAVDEPGTIVAAVGGGGLISGIAAAVKAQRPSCRVVGVQAAGAATFPASLAVGEPRAAESVTTIADGIAVKRPGDLTFAHVTALVDEVVTVSDEATAGAVLLLVERAKQVVEPSGAVPLAAVLEQAFPLVPPVVVILGGGNVDPLLLVRILQSGLTEEGRYFAFRTRLLDRPGSLSALLALLADLGANVVAVEHHRFGVRLGLLQVEVELEVETRGQDHIRHLVDALIDAGYPIA